MKKHTLYLAAIILMVTAIIGCQDKPKQNGARVFTDEKGQDIPDSTIYGVCGDNTAMHTLELIRDDGDTLHYLLPDDSINVVAGGLLVGDRLAVVEGPTVEGDKTASKVINLTTLVGKWTSLDKNFEIEEGGVVKSFVEAEKNPWTSWKILNGHLVLNRDTFDIDELGSDSLYLENKQGIFVYKRAK